MTPSTPINECLKDATPDRSVASVLIAWEAPTVAVAARWRDELAARGTRADIAYRWNAVETKVIVQFWQER